MSTVPVAPKPKLTQKQRDVAKCAPGLARMKARMMPGRTRRAHAATGVEKRKSKKAFVVQQSPESAAAARKHLEEVALHIQTPNAECIWENFLYPGAKPVILLIQVTEVQPTVLRFVPFAIQKQGVTTATCEDDFEDLQDDELEPRLAALPHVLQYLTVFKRAES
jgi:hypothetical protein